jgi:hypothetical protein
MYRFIEGEDRMQPALLPHCLEDYVDEENPVRVIVVFIGELNLASLGFSGMTPAATGRPAYRPSTLLNTSAPLWGLTKPDAPPSGKGSSRAMEMGGEPHARDALKKSGMVGGIATET